MKLAACILQGTKPDLKQQIWRLIHLLVATLNPQPPSHLVPAPRLGPTRPVPLKVPS